jgi:hypothetical protein
MNGHFIYGLLIGLVIGFVAGNRVNELDVEVYTLNSVEENLTLKQMAYFRFEDAYKQRFDDWKSL